MITASLKSGQGLRAQSLGSFNLKTDSTHPQRLLEPLPSLLPFLVLGNQGRVVVLQGQLGLGGLVQSVAGEPELVGSFGAVAAGPGRVSSGQRHGWGAGRWCSGQSHPEKNEAKTKIRKRNRPRSSFESKTIKRG